MDSRDNSFHGSKALSRNGDHEEKKTIDPESAAGRGDHQPNPSGKEKDPVSNDDDEKYKSMKWWQAYLIMTAETVSIGILSLPSVLATVGIVPGVLLIAGLGGVATYTGYTIWQFKMEYLWVSCLLFLFELYVRGRGRGLFNDEKVLISG